MAEWRVERLNSTHDRAGFASGKPSLDDYIQRFARQYEKRHLGRTYVAVQSGDRCVRGYYTLASASIAFQHLPPAIARKLPKHPVPVVLLARLAVDQTVQGQGLGKLLLFDALQRCLNLEQVLGIHAVEVEVFDPEAQAFYEKFGFIPLHDRPLHLYLPVDAIESGFK